jgi:hypothetical protein
LEPFSVLEHESALALKNAVAEGIASPVPMRHEPFSRNTPPRYLGLTVTVDGAIGRLAQLIQENQPCVVLTGAGCSQESGIPTFRGPDYVPEKDGDKQHLSTEM